MERHEVLAMMTALKLAGMRTAYDDILADGLKRRHPVQQIIGTLLQTERRRRFIAPTDSDHDSPIFSNRAKDVTADRPNQLWVADITYVAIAPYVAIAVWFRLCRRHPRCVVTPRRWLCHQPLDRYAAHLGSAQGRFPVTTAAKGLYPPFGSRIARRAQPVVATRSV